MDKSSFEKNIINPSKQSLKIENLNNFILLTYLKKWIKNNKIQTNQKIIDLINYIEKNKQDFKNKKSIKNFEMENQFKETNFLEKKLFQFLKNNYLTLNDDINKLLESIDKKN
jgi:hypothetical protein